MYTPKYATGTTRRASSRSRSCCIEAAARAKPSALTGAIAAQARSLSTRRWMTQPSAPRPTSRDSTNGSGRAAAPPRRAIRTPNGSTSADSITALRNWARGASSNTARSARATGWGGGGTDQPRVRGDGEVVRRAGFKGDGVLRGDRRGGCADGGRRAPSLPVVSERVSRRMPRLEDSADYATVEWRDVYGSAMRWILFSVVLT